MLVATSKSVIETLAALLSNTRVKFALTAIGASLATSVVLLSYQAFQRRSRALALKRELAGLPAPENVTESHGIPASAVNYDEALVNEQLARNIAFLGKEGVLKLRKSFVIIVGAGGVGSWAAMMLLRSGVEHMRIIDFDQVTLSSLNRHAVATHADVGFPKVVALQKAFMQIAPWAKIEPIIELFNNQSAPKLLSGNPDYIVDAIDNIDTKLGLLKYCHDNALPASASGRPKGVALNKR